MDITSVQSSKSYVTQENPSNPKSQTDNSVPDKTEAIDQYTHSSGYGNLLSYGDTIKVYDSSGNLVELTMRPMYEAPDFLDRLERTFSLIGSVVGAPTKRINEEINSAWDVYEEYKGHIQSTFTGKEQDKYMAKLHELVSQRIEKVTNTYTDKIGDFLAEYGVEGEKNALRESMLALFKESVSAKLSMSLADFGISISEHESKNLYSLDDFYALGFMMQATYEAGARETSNNRDEFTAQFILYSMEKESIYAAFSTNDSLKDKLETVFSNRVNEIIDRKNESFTRIKELAKAYDTTLSEEDLALWTNYKKEPIWQLINNVAENIRSGQSAQATLEKFDNYFPIFFNNYNAINPRSIDFALAYGLDTTKFWYKPEISFAIKFNELLTHIGHVSKLSAKGIALSA